MNTILFVGEHPKTYDVRWHTHEHWELVYCTSGQGSFRFENGTVMTYQTGEVVVIPPRCENSNVLRTLGGFLGDISVRRFILEDPLLTVGFREYTGREPMKSISWTQSARVGRPLVKQYDHTVDATVTVLRCASSRPYFSSDSGFHATAEL